MISSGREHNNDVATLREGCWCGPYMIPLQIVAMFNGEVVDAVAAQVFHRDGVARAIDAKMGSAGLGPYRVLWPVERAEEA